MIGDEMLIEKDLEYLRYNRVETTRSVYAKYQPGYFKDAANGLNVRCEKKKPS